MKFRKSVIGLSAVIFLFFLSIPWAPVGCPKGSPSVCGLISNLIVMSGGLFVLTTKIDSKILPGTSVLVELDNGEIKPGVLSRQAIAGRPVKPGDKVRLNCLKYPIDQNSKGKLCELEFFGFDPYSSCVKGSPCYGKIPSWTISVDEKGRPDPELLKFQ